MNREQFVNNAASTLNGAITNSQTSITVADGSPFPADGDFRLIVENELLLCTARSGNVLTVQRGVEGSTAAAHGDGAAVTHIVTAGSLDRWGRDNVALWGSRPPFRLGGLVAADFTTVNLGASTTADESGTILLRVAPDSAEQVRALVRSVPSTPYSYVMALKPLVLLGDPADGSHFGVLFRESSTGKMVLLSINVFDGSYHWAIYRYTNETTGATNYKDRRQVLNTGCFWFKLEDDGTNLKFYLGDGVDWVEMFSVSRTDFMAGGPDQIGWFGATGLNGDYPSLIRLVHWGAE